LPDAEPSYGPVSRLDLIHALRAAGDEGPYPGSNHQVMARWRTKVPIPNAHTGDIGLPLLSRIPRQAGVSREEWEKLP
jgi:hypothetical protein